MVEHTIFAVTLNEQGAWAEGTAPINAVFRLPVDANLYRVSVGASCATAEVQVGVYLDDGSEVVIVSSDDAHTLTSASPIVEFGYGDFSFGADGTVKIDSYPHVPKGRDVHVDVSVVSGTLFSATVVLFFLAG